MQTKHLFLKVVTKTGSASRPPRTTQAAQRASLVSDACGKTTSRKTTSRKTTCGKSPARPAVKILTEPAVRF